MFCFLVVPGDSSQWCPSSVVMSIISIYSLFTSSEYSVPLSLFLQTFPTEYLFFSLSIQPPNYPTTPLCVFQWNFNKISQWNIYFLAPLSQVRFVISFRFYFLCCSLKCLLVCSLSLFLHTFSTECFFCFILLANAPEKLQHNLWNLCFLLLFPCLLSVHTEFTMLVLKCLLVSLSLFPT